MERFINIYDIPDDSTSKSVSILGHYDMATRILKTIAISRVQIKKENVGDFFLIKYVRTGPQWILHHAMDSNP